MGANTFPKSGALLLTGSPGPLSLLMLRSKSLAKLLLLLFLNPNCRTTAAQAPPAAVTPAPPVWLPHLPSQSVIHLGNSFLRKARGSNSNRDLTQPLTTPVMLLPSCRLVPSGCCLSTVSSLFCMTLLAMLAMPRNVAAQLPSSSNLMLVHPGSGSARASKPTSTPTAEEEIEETVAQCQGCQTV
jgi:hypothetical protein